jgi:hypothetical protein
MATLNEISTDRGSKIIKGLLKDLLDYQTLIVKEQNAVMLSQ